ncbi:hypothetical protein COCNU_15G006110 [Cocos nucifera]|uniref:Uncharacterized protein n=1 Tax=Cocos nucifera TaxID=13894 RepID=A0A8K0IXF8_COCNU|nr:hypothetical protein COCNU_15G006110 [Cocos nucifera]
MVDFLTESLPGTAASLPSHMPPDPIFIPSDEVIEVSHDWVYWLSSRQTICDIIPMSSNISIMDVKMPVKQAFLIMPWNRYTRQMAADDATLVCIQLLSVGFWSYFLFQGYGSLL